MPPANGPIVSGYIDVQARFESMRRHPQHTQVFRRHEDLRRECERRIRAYEKETRLVTTKLTRIQSEYQDRIKVFENTDGEAGSRKNSVGETSRKIKNKHQVEVVPPKLHKERRRVLLFRVQQREGKNIYIREPKKRLGLGGELN